MKMTGTDHMSSFIALHYVYITSFLSLSLFIRLSATNPLHDRVLDLLDDTLLLWVSVLVNIGNTGSGSTVRKTGLVAGVGPDVVTVSLSLGNGIGSGCTLSAGQCTVSTWSRGVLLGVLVGVDVSSVLCNSVTVAEEVLVGGGELLVSVMLTQSIDR